MALGLHCEWMVCAVSVKMDVCIALGVRCECQDGCVHSSGIAL